MDFKNLNFSNFKLNSEQRLEFEEFFNKTIAYNKTHNITRIVKVEDFEIKHCLDSIYPMIEYLDYTNIVEKKVCDLGTGAGFPVIPLAIVNKKNKFWAVDSKSKKIHFIKKMTRELGLKMIEPLNTRIEDLEKIYKEAFDIVTIRAVRIDEKILNNALKILKKGGYFCIYSIKTNIGSIKKTLEQLDKRGFTEIKTFEYLLPNSDIQRFFLICKK